MQIGIHIPSNFTNVELLKLRDRPVQLCVGSPLSIPSMAVAKEIRDRIKGSPLREEDVMLHSSFLINLAATDEGKRKRAVGMAKFSIKTGEVIGSSSIVFHAGSGLPSKLMTSLQEIEFAANSKPRILIENDCGGGQRIGSIRVLAAVRYHLSNRIGVCFDTMHSYARGETYDLGGLQKAYNFCKPELIHLNDVDPEVEFGSHRDRHKGILGEGRYGEDIFKFALWVGNRTPMIIEAAPEIAFAGLRRLEERA